MPQRQHLIPMLLAAALMGCGGGGADSASPPPSGTAPSTGAPTTPTTPAPVAPEPAALDVLAFSTPPGISTTTPKLSVWDPLAAGPALGSHAMASGFDAWQSIGSFSVDPGTQRYTYLGATAAAFIAQGMVYQLDLRRGSSTTPQRISSITNACGLTTYWPITFAAQADGWLEVDAAGADGSCTSTADNTRALVRLGSPTTTAPTVLPAGLTPLRQLPTSDHSRAAAFLVLDKQSTVSSLALYNPNDWTRLSQVAGSVAIDQLRPLTYVPGTGFSALYVQTGNSLRRLRWANGLASLSGELLRFTNLPSNGWFAHLATDEFLYVADDTTVRQVDANGAVTTLATFPTLTNASTELYGATSQHLIVQRWAGSTRQPLLALHRLTGTLTTPRGSSTSTAIVGLHGDEVVYTTGSATYRRIGVDGSNDRLIASSPTEMDGVILQRSTRFGQPYPVQAVLSCTAAAGDTGCHRGELRAHRLSDGSTLRLGSFAITDGYGLWKVSADGFANLPLTIRTQSMASPSLIERNYLAHPDRADALRLTESSAP